MYLVQTKTRKVLLFRVYVIIFKITTSLWMIFPVDTRRCLNVDTTSCDVVSTLKQRRLSTGLILHPGHTSLFLKTAMTKFMGPWVEGRKTDTRNNCSVFVNSIIIDFLLHVIIFFKVVPDRNNNLKSRYKKL